MFGFLKDKLKQWVDKAKDKIGPAESSEEVKEEIKEEVKKAKSAVPKKAKEEKKKEIKEKKEKEKPSKKKKDLEEPSVSKEENVESPEVTNSELIQPDVVKEVSKEQEQIREITEELEKEEITPKEAVEEIQEVHEKTEKEIKEKKSLLGRLFGKKESVESSVSKEENIAPLETVQKPKEIVEEEEEKVESSKADLESEELEPATQKKSFFEKVKSSFIYKITEEDFESLFEDLDMLLLENNVALEVVEDIKSKLSKKLIGKEIKKDDLENEIKTELKNTLNEILIDPDDPVEAVKMKKDKPFVILFFGINGTGKTTSIAKLAYKLKQKNISVALAAGDTFRAASIEQISEHAKKLEVPLIKHDYGADPSAVGFDAIKYAKSHGIDVVLIDTAGRMHTKTNLISEMEKIVRVTNPDLKIFVAESIAGNDAVEQAKTFHEAIEIDGSILSKADVDEKGGTIISVSHSTNKPIFYLGTGQEYKDLKLFNKQDYIQSLGL
ncbi:Signal recognition particle receptor FtsY [uncultured archaeon]|nr:Signal recognition particle receptor FtsY [uncultured archaeon]